MKPGKYQRSKQRCTIFSLYTMRELRNQHVPQFGVNNYRVLCKVSAENQNNNVQQRTLTSFITIPLYVSADSADSFYFIETLRHQLQV